MLDNRTIPFFASDHDAAQVRRDEGELCRKSDLVVTTCMSLHVLESPCDPNTILVPHGVDYDHFSRVVKEDLPAPADIASIPRPRVGFFGLIRDWFDLDLLAEVARRRPDWHIVLLGDSTFDLLYPQGCVLACLRWVLAATRPGFGKKTRS